MDIYLKECDNLYENMCSLCYLEVLFDLKMVQLYIMFLFIIIKFI